MDWLDFLAVQGTLKIQTNVENLEMELKEIMSTCHKGNSPGIPSPTEDACALPAVVGMFDKGLINTQFAVHLRAQGHGGEIPCRGNSIA